MTITFIGLSSFLIENRTGHRILIDPFNDAPQWRLGPIFPKTFAGKPFGANLVLMSEPDADHAHAPGGWLQNAPTTKPGKNPFVGIGIHGTVVHEWNGDLNIAWSYAVDGIRCTHLADNAHVLSVVQLKEIGRTDVLFVSAPKVADKKNLDVVRKNIAALRPKAVVWAHHLAPEGMPSPDNTEELRAFFLRYFKKNVFDNGREGKPEDIMQLCTVLEAANALHKEYVGKILTAPRLELKKADLARRKRPISYLFLSMVAKP